jgi:hypothetical protein
MNMRRRFLACFTWSLIAFAVLNSLSYFVRSAGWGNLFGEARGYVGIGFPWLVWQYESSGVAPLPDSSAIAQNVAIGLLASAVVSLVFMRLNRPSASVDRSEPHEPSVASGFRMSQFNLRSLFLFTAITAVLLGAARTSSELNPALLKVIYLGGPCTIAWVGYLARCCNVRWQVVLTLSYGSLLVIATGVLSQHAVGINDFTQGILGIFVCWIPQFFILALIARVFEQRRQRYRQGEGDLA